MGPTSICLASFPTWARRTMSELRNKDLEMGVRFCLRMTLVGLFAFAIAQLLTIPLHGLWVVTQMSADAGCRMGSSRIR